MNVYLFWNCSKLFEELTTIATNLKVWNIKLKVLALIMIKLKRFRVFGLVCPIKQISLGVDYNYNKFKSWVLSSKIESFNYNCY